MQRISRTSLLLVAAVVLATAGQAATRPKVITIAKPNKQMTTDLNSAECTGAGGTVYADKTCASKNICVRADANGVIHQVCIVETAH